MSENIEKPKKMKKSPIQPVQEVKKLKQKKGATDVTRETKKTKLNPTPAPSPKQTPLPECATKSKKDKVEPKNTSQLDLSNSKKKTKKRKSTEAPIKTEKVVPSKKLKKWEKFEEASKKLELFESDVESSVNYSDIDVFSLSSNSAENGWEGIDSELTSDEDEERKVSVVPYNKQQDYSSEEDEDDFDYSSSSYSSSSDGDAFGDFSSFREGSSDDESFSGEEEMDSEEESELDDSFDGQYDFEDESDDTDYELPENEDDLYVPQGAAVKYDFAENTKNLSFKSDLDELQIIELPSETKEIVQQVEEVAPSKAQPKEIERKSEKSQSESGSESDDSCPELVPIDFDKYYDYDSETYTGSYEEGMSEEEQSDYSYDFLDYDDDDDDDDELDASIEMNPEIFKCEVKNERSKSVMEADSSFSQFQTDLPEIVGFFDKVAGVPSGKVVTVNGIVSEEKNLNTEFAVEENSSEVDDKSNDSIDSMEDEIEYLSEDECKSPKNVADFRSKFYDSVNSNKVILLLKDQIYIYGTLIVKTIAGAVEIFGYSPKLGESVEVFSPRGYSSLCIKTVTSSGTRRATIESELDALSSDFIKSDIQEILALYNDQSDSILILERNDRNKKIDMIKKYMKENLFPNMNSITLERPFYASEFILHCIITTASQNSLNLDPKWQTISVTEQSKIMAIGGKSVGKSTLIRYLINSQLKRFPKILLIDLDIGQSEMFVPQTISATLISQPLLGPGYFQTKLPEKSLLFGDIHVILSPQVYMDNVRELLSYCYGNEQFRGIPWLVNTMGYNKGFGSELIATVSSYLKPTDIIQLQCNREINNFDFILDREVVQNIPRNVFRVDEEARDYIPQHRLILFDSVVNGNYAKKKDWDMTPKDMRHANIVSRLGAALRGRAEWLTDVTPVSAKLDDVAILTFGGETLDRDDECHIANANLVYLCHKKGESDPIECYGIGIVRAVDMIQRKIYLIPSGPLELLNNINSLAICNIPLATPVILNQGPKIKGIAPYIYNTKDVAASKFINQIYHRPQKFLQGNRKSIMDE